MKINKPKNPVCVVWWHDAFYTDSKYLPLFLPQIQLTAGFIISENKKFINIATNVDYNVKTGRLWPVDGFLIPNRAIIKFKKISNLNEKS